MKKRRLTVVVLVICTLLVLSVLFMLVGNRLHRVRMQAKEAQVMTGFEQLMAKDSLTTFEVIKYLEKNINTVSTKNVSRFVLGLEQTQQDNLVEWQKRYEDTALQEKMAEIYQINWCLEELSNTTDQKLKEILLDTRENGFKVDTAEGLFFPVIDYTFYRRYQQALPPDLVAYFELMAVESEQTPLKDAALMIGWDEILTRAENQEQFVKEYQTSTQVKPVRRLLKRYVTLALFGCNNTPLFSYETKKMDPEAREVYTEYVRSQKEGEFFAMLAEFLKVLEENDYCLTKEVDDFREMAVAAW